MNRSKRSVVLLSILVLSANISFAQSDSLRLEIARYVSLNDDLEHKGRVMLRDLLLQGDNPAKVRSIVRFLQTELNPVYKPLTKLEESAVYFYLGDYATVLSMSDHPDSVILFEQPTNHPFDGLLGSISDKLSADSASYVESINRSEFDEVSKSFLRLQLSNIISYSKDQQRKELLNQMATTFLSLYPESKFDQHVRSDIRKIYSPTAWSQKIYLQGGFCELTDNLGRRFTNPSFVAAGLDISYKRFVFFFRGAVGSSETKDTIAFRAAMWGKKEVAVYEIIEFSAGFKALDREKITLTPFMGCSWTNFKPTDDGEKSHPLYKEIGFRMKPAYAIGVCADVRIIKDKVEAPQTRYDRFVRFRYACEMPQLQNTLAGFDGNLHSVSIAIGIAFISMHRSL